MLIGMRIARLAGVVGARIAPHGQEDGLKCGVGQDVGVGGKLREISQRFPSVASGSNPEIGFDAGHQRHANGLKSELFGKPRTFLQAVAGIGANPSEIDADFRWNRVPGRGAKDECGCHEQGRCPLGYVDAPFVTQSYILSQTTG